MADRINRSFYGRLKRLLSTNTVVRKVKGRLKVVDTGRLQSVGNRENSRYIDRFSRLHGGGPRNSLNYNQNYNYHASKTEIYTDYEVMDKDSIIASALDIYADEVTMRNSDGRVIDIVTGNEEIKKILENLFFDVMNLDFNLWSWVRNVCKYGDFYLHLDIIEDVGIVNVTPLSAYDIERQEGWDPDNPYAVRFVSVYGTHSTGFSQSQFFENYEIAHFRLLTDSNFLPYGRAMIEPARKVFKQLTLMEDAMLIHRIMRAPEKRVFKIDVGTLPSHEVDTFMQKVIDNSKKVPYVDPKTGDYNLKFNLQNLLEDFYLPVRGGQSGTEIDTLSGLQYDGINDVEYLKDRMLAALKIPKAYIGYEGDINAKATLAAEDVRFARTIDRIQRIIASELTKIAVIHLYSQGYQDEDLIDFEIHLQSPSVIFEQEKLQLLQTKVTLARDIKDSKVRSTEYIFREIFKMPEEEIEREREALKQDAVDTYLINTLESEGKIPVEETEEEVPAGTPPPEEKSPEEVAADVEKKAEEQPKEESKYSDVLPKGGSPKGGWKGAGRPKRGIKYGSVNYVRGEDPIGRKSYRTGLKSMQDGIEKRYEDLIKGLDSKFNRNKKKIL